MILHINHVQPGRADSTSGVVSTLLSLLEAGDIDPNTLGHLNVHIDWVQYKSNFREPVSIRRVLKDEELLPLAGLLLKTGGTTLPLMNGQEGITSSRSRSRPPTKHC